MKRTIIIGGGTFNHVRNHLSLAAPAFGSVAKMLNMFIKDSELVLTKMADSRSQIVTNQDISDYINELLLDKNVGTIVLSAAICDYELSEHKDIISGSHAERFKTKNGSINLELQPSDKIISKIRLARPDIFLVGFKTTTGATSEEQYYNALKFMKSTKCNLVLANDVVSRNNMMIVPEEAKYVETTNRTKAIVCLADMIIMRHRLTYNTTKLRIASNYPMVETALNFQEVIAFLTDNGGFIEDNGNGFTPGHFCWKIGENTFASSQRKADHNKVFEKGLTLVNITNDSDEIIAFGSKKPSVGATSQRMLFKDYPDYDCIVHTHNPIKENSEMNQVSQKPYQCGSLECGNNTLKGMRFKDGIGAVYLIKHGTNILFKSSDDPNKIIKFIKDNIQLGVKVQ